MSTLSDKKPRRKAVNLTVNEDLLDQAEQLHIDLSHSFEEHLKGLLAKSEGERWLAENKAAIEEYNSYVARRGVFSDGRRQF